jgi:hypothetical protein
MILGYLKSAKFIIMAVGFAVIATIIGALYFQNSQLRGDLQLAAANAATAEAAFNAQKAATAAAVANAQEWQQTFERLEGLMQESIDVSQAANAETRRLHGIFAEHDLERLATARPGLIARRITDGSNNAFGVLDEITAGGGLRPDGGTGSPTQPSEITEPTTD